ncbi:MAG TPA: DUF3783 domain-containing protein [Lachnospiraceae bacterium]|nr:DUF3783 domain-containing protein [Lachnospiraceae bacterium]
MTPQVLIYNITDPLRKKRLKVLLLGMKIRAKIISRDLYGQPIGVLAGLKDITPGPIPEQLPSMTDEMLILCYFPDALLNRFLLALRKNDLRIPLKAVLTPNNAAWNSYQIYGELQREDACMRKKQS